MLTPREKLFIRKAYEEKVVFDSTVIRDAVMNAVYNVNRKKGKKFKKLWTLIGKITRTEKQAYKETREKILEMEKTQPTNWIDKIYQANGWRRKKKGGQENG